MVILLLLIMSLGVVPLSATEKDKKDKIHRIHNELNDLKEDTQGKINDIKFSPGKHNDDLTANAMFENKKKVKKCCKCWPWF